MAANILEKWPWTASKISSNIAPLVEAAALVLTAALLPASPRVFILFSFSGGLGQSCQDSLSQEVGHIDRCHGRHLVYAPGTRDAFKMAAGMWKGGHFLRVQGFSGYVLVVFWGKKYPFESTMIGTRSLNHARILRIRIQYCLYWGLYRKLRGSLHAMKQARDTNKD